MPKPPQRKTEWKDQYTLLCESCGYILEGLDQSLPCPECGKPITESLPERRVGTPWQQKPGFKSLLQTWGMTISNPFKTLDQLRPCTSGIDSLKIVSCAATSFVMLGAIYLLQIRTLIQIDRLNATPLILFFVEASTFFVLLLILLLGLTWIESFGLRFIGRRKRFRVSPSLSNAITSHACAGWVLGSILFGSGLFIGLVVFEYSTPSISLSSSDFKSFDELIQTAQNVQVPPAPRWAEALLIGLPWFGFLLGFLFFETFAYLGLRRCKYANTLPPKEQSDG